MKAMIWTAALFISLQSVIFSFSIISITVFAALFALFMIEKISDIRRQNETNRFSRYSRFGNQFGGNFKDSSGGIYYGDGFKGVNGTFGGGFR